MNNDRNIGFDVLNCIACFSVICLHHSSIVHHYSDSGVWNLSLMVECLFYFAVPCFFMLSGATLIRYDERYDTKTFFIKRFKRTMIPFLLWSLIWMLINILQGYESITNLSFWHIVDGVLNSKYQPIYWFFIPLFMIYLLMPLLNKAKDDIWLVRYLIVLFFLFRSCLPIVSHFYDVNFNQMISVLFGPLLYVLCGYYISMTNLSKRWLICIGIVSLISVVIRYFVTMVLSMDLEVTNRLLFDYYLPTAVFPSLFMFAVVTKCQFNISDNIRNLFTTLSSLSFGIYLVHKLVMACELRILCTIDIEENSLIWIVFMPFITWMISIGLVFSIKKFRFSKYIFP